MSIELIEIADSVRDRGDINGAIELYQQAVKQWTKAINENPGETESHMYLAVSYSGLGACYCERKDYDKAEPDDIDKTEHFFGVAQGMLERLFVDTQNYEVLLHLIVTLQNQAILALEQSDIARCEQNIEALDKWVKQLKSFEGIVNKPVLAEAVQNKIRADIARKQGRHEVAIDFIERAIELANRAKAHHLGRSEANLWLELLCYLAEIHTELKQFSQGLNVLKTAIHYLEFFTDSPILLNMTKISQLAVMTQYHFLLRKTGASVSELDDIAERAANLLDKTPEIHYDQMSKLRMRYNQEFDDNL
ncbi:tetratricopeptide repeat protein [Idiomarina ramblicola]|uniref:Tetratricopeptide repeat protein n=1 Tax=Idiomarina ramblicola TaxID=263724 RepID=A0A432Z0B3_9GAMM|nr:tetratricopeptide repeat protein [Idiomarina ramblicola]RUO69587.1 hypothetical protein CWI78_06595 [Idiomarina ramblicola]